MMGGDMTIYVKELLPSGLSPHQRYPWPLPVQDAAGEWQPGAWVEANRNAPLEQCGNGLHAYTEAQAQPNLRRDRAYWVIKYAEPPTDWGDKVSGYKARLLRPYPLPAWLLSVQPAFDALKAIPWLKPDGNPDPSWRLFPTRAAAGAAAWAAVRDAARAAAWDAAGAAARDAARDAAGDAAGAAAWDAAGDATLYVAMTAVCSDLPIAQEHRDHAEARMNVWRKGYGLLCDVDGMLYVYESVKAES